MLDTPTEAQVQAKLDEATADFAGARIESRDDARFAAFSAEAYNFGQFVGNQISDTELAARLLRANGTASPALTRAIWKAIAGGFAARGVVLTRAVEWKRCRKSHPQAIAGKRPTKFERMSPRATLKATMTPPKEFADAVAAECNGIWTHSTDNDAADLAAAIADARANPERWPPGYVEYLARDDAAEDCKLRVRAEAAAKARRAAVIAKLFVAASPEDSRLAALPADDDEINSDWRREGEQMPDATDDGEQNRGAPKKRKRSNARQDATQSGVVVSLYGQPIPPADDNWQANLIRKEDRSLKPRLTNNFIWMLRGHAATRGVFALNEFSQNIVLVERPAWEPGGDDWQPRNLADGDAVFAVAFLERQGLTPRKGEAFDAIKVAAKARAFHPVRHYLESLKWDGRPRLASCGVTYFGAPAGRYAEEIFTRWMISAVARIFRPGCKVDCVLVLEGKQGIFKSTSLRILGEPWFTDQIETLGTKDSAQQLQGAWIVELAELGAIRRAKDQEKTKAFLAQVDDRFRPPYGHVVSEIPRQCVFAGTVNPDGSGWLHDPTGARRFWPVACTKIDTEALRRDRDQIWAEAVHRFGAGELWHLDAETEALARDEQEARQEEETWGAAVARYVEKLAETSTAEILQFALNIELGKQTRSDTTRVGIIMRGLGGWTRRKVGHAGGIRWFRIQRQSSLPIDDEIKM